MQNLRTQVSHLRDPNRKPWNTRARQPKRTAGSMKRKVCAHTLPLLLKALFEAPCSLHDLIALTGLGQDGVRSFVNAMRQEKLIHISEWSTQGTHYVPVYAFGPGEDVTTRWSMNEKKLLEIFKSSSKPLTQKHLANLIGRSKSAIKKDLDALLEKGYVIKRPGQNSCAPNTWTKNNKMPLPVFSQRNLHAKTVVKQTSIDKPKPKINQQSWFSSIV